MPISPVEQQRIVDARRAALQDAQARQGRRLGAGDLVAAALKPAVSAIDRIVGSNLRNCAGCARRQEQLNVVVNRLLGR